MREGEGEREIERECVYVVDSSIPAFHVSVLMA
jgi:hypothetical protein